MADTTPPPVPTAGTQATSDSSSLLSSTSVIEALKSGASVDPLDYLAAVEAKTTDEAKPKSEDEVTPVTKTATESEETEANAEVEADTEHAEDVEVPKDAKEQTPEWVSERLSKMAAQKRELREQLAAEKSARESIESELAKAKELPSTPLPASPLAHLDTPEKLATESEKATNYLEWAESPEALEAYKDDETSTAEDKLKQNKAYALFILKNQTAHAALLKQREESLAAAKKAAPNLFDPKREENTLLGRFTVNDPRTQPDFHTVLADAVAWREYVKKTAEAKETTRKTLADKVTASKDKAKVNGKTPPVFAPSVSASRAPVSSAEASDPKVSFWSRAKEQAQDVDLMISAGAF